MLPSSPTFHYGSAGVSHTRSLSFLRAHLGGPVFDLEAIWDEHTAFEFATRSVAQTMGTSMLLCSHFPPALVIPSNRSCL